MIFDKYSLADLRKLQDKAIRIIKVKVKFER